MIDQIVNTANKTIKRTTVSPELRKLAISQALDGIRNSIISANLGLPRTTVSTIVTKILCHWPR